MPPGRRGLMTACGCQSRTLLCCVSVPGIVPGVCICNTVLAAAEDASTVALRRCRFRERVGRGEIALCTHLVSGGNAITQAAQKECCRSTRFRPSHRLTSAHASETKLFVSDRLRTSTAALLAHVIEHLRQVEALGVDWHRRMGGRLAGTQRQLPSACLPPPIQHLKFSCPPCCRCTYGRYRSDLSSRKSLATRSRRQPRTRAHRGRAGSGSLSSRCI